MIKKFFFSLICIMSISAFSYNAAAYTICNRALPTDSPAFCKSFKEAASCYCKERKDRPFPAVYCENTSWLYGMMVSTYGTLSNACENQKETSKQDCIDNWNCYMKGGTDSTGKSCSSTKKSCV
jgi:hypothetical protein